VDGVVVLLLLLLHSVMHMLQQGGPLGWGGLSACGLSASRKPDQLFQSIMISGLQEDENEAFLEIAGYHFHENHRAGPDSKCGKQTPLPDGRISKLFNLRELE